MTLLRFGAEGKDGIHDQGPLHRREGANAGITALELLHDEAIGDAGQAGTAVFLGQIGAQHAQLRHLGHELVGEATLHIALADNGEYAFVYELADGVANGALLFGEGGIDVEQVGGVRLKLYRRQRGNVARGEEISRHWRDR